MNKKVLVFGISYNVNPKYDKFELLKKLNESPREDIVLLLPAHKITEEIALLLRKNEIEYHLFSPITGEIDGTKVENPNFNIIKENSVNRSLTFFSKRDSQRSPNMTYSISNMYNQMKNFYISLEAFVKQNDFKYGITWGASPYSFILDDVFTNNNSYVIYLELGYFRNYGIQASSIGPNYHGEILAEYVLNEFDPNYTQEQIDYYFSTKSIPTGENESTENKEFVLNNEYVFVPMQINVDTQIIFNSDYIKNMEQLIQEAIELVTTYNKRNNANIKLLIKVHPWHSFQDLLDNYEYLAEKYSEYAYFVETGDLEYLLYNAKAVITINSTVGVQALDMYKKVMCLGNSIYSVPNIAYIPHNKLEFYQVFEEMMLDKGKRKEDIDRFLQYLYFNKHIQMKNYQLPTIKEIDNFYSSINKNEKSFININNNVTNITSKVVGLYIKNNTQDTKYLKFGDSIEKVILPGNELYYKFFAPLSKVVNINTDGLDYNLSLEAPLNKKYGNLKIDFIKGKKGLKVFFVSNYEDYKQYNNEESCLFISSSSIVDVIGLMINQDGKSQNDNILNKIEEYRNFLGLVNEDITFIGSEYYAYFASIYSYHFPISKVELIDPNLNINNYLATLSEDILLDLKTKKIEVESLNINFKYLKGTVKFNEKKFRDSSTMNSIRDNSNIMLQESK